MGQAAVTLEMTSEGGNEPEIEISEELNGEGELPIHRSVRSLKQFVMFHVVRSKQPKCPSFTCTKMKYTINKHLKKCPTKGKGNCVTCDELMNTCCYHAKHCHEMTIKATAGCPGRHFDASVVMKRNHLRLAHYGSYKLDRLRFVDYFYEKESEKEAELGYDYDRPDDWEKHLREQLFGYEVPTDSPSPIQIKLKINILIEKME